jgi:hypothetical protein
MEACVFQQQHIAGFQDSRSFFSYRSDAIGGKGHLFSQHLGKMFGYGFIEYFSSGPPLGRPR